MADVYEIIEPRSEMKQTPEAFLLHVYLPDFTKDYQIEMTLVDDSTVKVTGVRRVEANRWIGFNNTYRVQHCEADLHESKFVKELGIVIIKWQKNKHLIPQVEETPQEKSPSDHNKAVVDEAAMGHEKVQETIPPPPQQTTTTTTKVEEQPPTEDKSSASPNKAQKAIQEDTSSSQTPTEPIGDHNPQKGQEEATKRHEVMGPKPQMGKEKFEPKPTSTETTKTQADEKASKGQEEAEPKPALTTVTRDPAEEKSQEENKLKTRVATVKEQLEEKIVGKSAEDAKKERISKKEIEKEEDEKPSESRKPHSNKFGILQWLKVRAAAVITAAKNSLWRLVNRRKFIRRSKTPSVV